jgi:hypothetical protein
MDEQELRPPARPAWVIRLAIVVAILIVTAIIVMILFPGQHGPGRHL